MAYGVRLIAWISDVCSPDLSARIRGATRPRSRSGAAVAGICGNSRCEVRELSSTRLQPIGAALLDIKAFERGRRASAGSIVGRRQRLQPLGGDAQNAIGVDVGKIGVGRTRIKVVEIEIEPADLVGQAHV